MVRVPPPFLFNIWKHHAGAIGTSIAEFVARGEEGMEQLRVQIAVIGAALMDLYTGNLSVEQICGEILESLQKNGVLVESAYQRWLRQQGGFAVVSLSDTSRWVLREGVAGNRFVHIHPGRWSPHTIRVRANLLKTAVMVHAWCRLHGESPWDIEIINRIRRDWLDLPPVVRVDPDRGLGAVLGMLRGTGS